MRRKQFAAPRLVEVASLMTLTQMADSVSATGDTSVDNEL